MTMLLERRRGLGADAQGGGVGGPELRMSGVKGLQLPEQAIVLGVRQFRTVEHVVGVVGSLEEPPQLGGPRGDVRHRPLASSWITARATPTRRSSSSALAR